MKNKFPILLLLILLFSMSCSKKEKDLPEEKLSEYDLKVIDYFKDIALGFEFGNSSEIIRKWNSTMKIFVGGTPSPELSNEIEKIKDEINDLATDGFKIELVTNRYQSNFYIFFGSGNDYASLYPSQSILVQSNKGLFSVFWNSSNQLESGHMYIDIERTNPIEQAHLLREELTQSLGLGKDSAKYIESIFQSQWTTTVVYAEIDKDLIRLLYHPDMTIGLNENQVDIVLKNILTNE